MGEDSAEIANTLDAPNTAVIQARQTRKLIARAAKNGKDSSAIAAEEDPFTDSSLDSISAIETTAVVDVIEEEIVDVSDTAEIVTNDGNYAEITKDIVNT